MYRRENSAAPVRWEPSDTEAAKQAMREVDGTGVPDAFTLPDDAPVPVSDEVAQDVREEYQRLTSDGGQ